MIQKIKHSILLVLAAFCWGTTNAQLYNQELDEFSPEATKRDKLGVRLGFGLNTLRSGDLQNTKVTRGYQGAFYYRVNLFKGFHLNSEFGASIRGARHDNGDLSYSQISLFYFDVNILGMIQLDPGFKHSIIAGVQGSRLMRSSLFIGPEPFPAFLQLPFKKYDLDAVVGYHFNTRYAGFQLALKYGLLNIAGDFASYNKQSLNNNAVQFIDLKPGLRDVKNIKNLSIELSVYF